MVELIISVAVVDWRPVSALRTDLPRRRLLQAVAALPLLAACRPAKRPATPDPDAALRTAAVERERMLLALYDAAAAGSGPADAAVLQAVRAEHAEHLAALLGRATPSPSPSPAPSPVATPATRPQLVAAERSAAQAHAAAAVTAGAELAGLLASLAASEASHPVALT